MTKSITLRIPAQTGVIVESVAEVRHSTVSDIIREALDKYLNEVLREPGFLADFEKIQREKFELVSARAE